MSVSVCVCAQHFVYTKAGVIGTLTCMYPPPHFVQHFVCTKAGFLHSLDSKFDSLARESIPLHNARITTVDDDACALAIEYHSGPIP